MIRGIERLTLRDAFTARFIDVDAAPGSVRLWETVEEDDEPGTPMLLEYDPATARQVAGALYRAADVAEAMDVRQRVLPLARAA